VRSYIVVRLLVPSSLAAKYLRRIFMDKWTFGLTMLVVGMGGTILTLILFSLIMSLLKKLFPYRQEEE
jgi:hypothetical protein